VVQRQRPDDQGRASGEDVSHFLRTKRKVSPIENEDWMLRRDKIRNSWSEKTELDRRTGSVCEDLRFDSVHFIQLEKRPYDLVDRLCDCPYWQDDLRYQV
jgi:hypothetical protein